MKYKKLITAMLAATLVLTSVPNVVYAVEPTVITDSTGIGTIALKVNDKDVSVGGHYIDGSTYLTFEEINSIFGSEAKWDSTNGKAIIKTSDGDSNISSENVKKYGSSYYVRVSELNKIYNISSSYSGGVLNFTTDNDSKVPSLISSVSTPTYVTETEDEKRKRVINNVTEIFNRDFGFTRDTPDQEAQDTLIKALQDATNETDMDKQVDLSIFASDLLGLVDKYYTQRADGSYPSYQDLQLLAASQDRNLGVDDGSTEQPDQDNTPVDPSSLESVVGTAQGGYYESEDDYITNTEKEYRSNDVNLKLIKDNLEQSTSKIKDYMSKYRSDYKGDITYDNVTISSHKDVVVYNPDTNEFGGTLEDNSRFEYDALASMLKIDLVGLESIAMLNTLLNNVDDIDKDAYKEKLNELTAKETGVLTAEFCPEDDPQLIGEKSVQVLRTTTNGDAKAGALSRFMLHDSFAALSKEAYEKDNGAFKDKIDEFLTAGFTVSEVFYRRFMSMQNAITSANVPITYTESTDDDIKKLIEDTKKRNEDGKEIIDELISTPIDYSDVLGSVPLTDSRFFYSSQLAFWARMLNGGTESSNYNSVYLKSPIITNNYTVLETSAGKMPTNSFLTMEHAIYGALDFKSLIESIKNGVEESAQDDVLLKSMLNCRSGYVELIKVGRALANFYDLMGYPDRAKALRDYVSSQMDAFNAFADSLDNDGLHLIDSKEVNVKDSIIPETVKDIEDEKDEEKAEVVKLEELRTNPAYYELIAWTSAFTPFETNVLNFSAAENAAHLSPTAREIYRDRLGKFTPLYAVDDGVGAISKLQQGSVRNMSYITLRDFITRQNTDDLVLFANKYTEEEMYEYKMKGVLASNDGTKSMNTRSDNDNHFIGPVYISSSDSSYVTGKNKYKVGETSDVYDDYDLTSTDEINAKNDTTQEVEKEGYTYSGIQTSGTNAISGFLNHKTPNHYYYNYVLMYNTLKDGGQNTSALVEDMDRPLYMDFIGNIVTESGYVVVPTAANTTFYGEDLQKYYPMFTAMFMNSYPDVKSGSDENIQLLGKDVGKYVLAMIPDKATYKKVNYETDMSEELKEKEFDKGTSDYNSYFVRAKDSKENSEFVDKLYITFPRTSYNTFMDFESGDNSGSVSIQPGFDSDEPDKGLVEVMPVESSFKDMGPAYIKANLFWGDSNDYASKVYTKEGYNTTQLDEFGSVAMNGISPLGADPSWKLAIRLNTCLYLNKNIQPTGNSPDGILEVDTLIRIAEVVEGSSTNVEDMLVDWNATDYESLIKDDKVLKSLGDFMEGLVNKIYGKFSSNILLYVPKFSAISLLDKAFIYAKPLTAMGLILVLSVIVIAVFLQRMGKDSTTLYDVLVGGFLVVLLFMYNLNFHPQVMTFLFETIPSWIMSGQTMNYVAYDLDSDNKVDKTQFFADIKETSEGKDSILIKVKELDDEEVIRIRSNYGDGRKEVESVFYDPKYDSTYLPVIGTDIFLRNKSLYMSIDTLFDGSRIVDIANMDGSATLQQDIYDNTGNLMYFTPYYNILESLIYTINTYAEGCDAQLKLKNYASQVKTTGRATSYFNSIFFIAPSGIPEMKEITRQQYLSNIQNLYNNKVFGNQDLSQDQIDENTKKMTHEVEEMATNIDLAYAYLIEGLGDLDDWLGLKKVLYLTDYPIPFDKDKKLNTILTDWYPECAKDVAFHNYGKGIPDEELNTYTEEQLKEKYGDLYKDMPTQSQIDALEAEVYNKIQRVNEAVKSYVINDLEDIAYCFSDETLLKIVALKATFEFNKVFSEPFGDKLYPQGLEVKGMDNKYTLLSSYLPKKDIYDSATDGLTYILAYKGGWPALLLGIVDAILRLIAYGIPIVAIWINGFLPFLLLICFALRRTRLVQGVYMGIIMTLILALFRYVNVINYILVDYTLTRKGIYWSLVSNILLSCLVILLAYATVVMVINSVKRSIKMMRWSLADSLESLINGNFGGRGYNNRYGSDSMYGRGGYSGYYNSRDIDYMGMGRNNRTQYPYSGGGYTSRSRRGISARDYYND